MNVSWTPTAAHRTDHVFVAPAVTEISVGGIEGGTQPPSRLGDAAGHPSDCSFAGSRFGCGVCDECAAYGDYLQDGRDR